MVPSSPSPSSSCFLLDGTNLSLHSLHLVASGGLSTVGLTPEAWSRVEKGRSVVEEVVEKGKVVYGINTGFGNFADVVISSEKLHQLQENLIRSHSVGVGRALSVNQTRALLFLRINCLARGHSGISRKTLEGLLDAFNTSCLSCVPSQVFPYILFFFLKF